MPRFWIVGASIFLAVLVAGLGAPTGAQGIATPYPLLMSRDTAKRVIAAWNEERPYVPGEVLVKFRDGVTPAEQGRAMSVMRAPLDSAETTWVGDVAAGTHSRGTRTPRRPPAFLAGKPEIEWAQPNYVRRLNAAPNDPAYSRQWNFDLIDMPRAWEMNQGATSDVTVAVIDTGITTMATAYPFSLWTGSQLELVNIPVGINPDIAAARIEPGLDFVFWAGPVIDMVGPWHARGGYDPRRDQQQPWTGWHRLSGHAASAQGVFRLLGAPDCSIFVGYSGIRRPPRRRRLP